MIITGDNLKQLMTQHGLVHNGSQNNYRAYDDNSISLTLDNTITRVNPGNEVVTYGNSINPNWVSTDTIPEEGFILAPREAVLACSNEIIKMPPGYMGILQTKGSLARLFVTVHCCDGQVETGYSGKVTFELCSFANFSIRLLPGAIVAQLFIFKLSTNNSPPYKGRYQGAIGPTIQVAK